mmetsp:Transcript_13199/g.24386  ORF Transcript_13199/g.24386 Transcript_13199/m.24386 type:complete len:300 (+) Transcript_13199:130-1029(+)
MKGYDAEDPSVGEVLLKKKQSSNPIAFRLNVAVLAAAPAAVFAVIVGLYTFLNHDSPVLVTLTIVALTGVSCGLWFWRSTSYGGPMFGRLLGGSCLLAIAIGLMSGRFNFQRNVAPYWAYEGQREYANVVPTEPALLHMDAGVMGFSSDSHVDVQKAVGYHNGHTYCVAPIVTSDAQTLIEYWAVGVDCCKLRGSFTCDDVGDPNVHGGLVMLDAAMRKQFAKAAREASATLGVSSSSDALFVQWVSSPSQAARHHWRAALMFFFSVSLLYACACIASGLLLCNDGFKPQALFAGRFSV